MAVLLIKPERQPLYLAVLLYLPSAYALIQSRTHRYKLVGKEGGGETYKFCGFIIIFKSSFQNIFLRLYLKTPRDVNLETSDQCGLTGSIIEFVTSGSLAAILEIKMYSVSFLVCHLPISFRLTKSAFFV